MTKKSSTSFKKGDKNNPSTGRQKGTLNKSTLIKRKIDENAEIDSEAAYKELRALMKEGNSTALQIYWDKLLGKRKRAVLVDKSKARLLALYEGLEDFEELTHDEIIKEITALSSTKVTAKIEEIKSKYSDISDDELLEKLDMIIALQEKDPIYNEFLEYKKNKAKLKVV